MNELLKNIRFWVVSFSIILSIIIFVIVKTTVPSGTIQIIKLTQIYALTAVTYLYVVLMATPITRYFKFLPFRSEYIKSRRALGVSTFYFACLHGYLAFFKQLGGFSGLGFLSSKYLIAITLSFIALLIFTFMAATAFDSMVEKLSFEKWKFLHRFVYLAGVLILIHALMLGTHFSNLSTTIPKIFFSALSVLLILEAKRFDDFLNQKFENLPSFGLAGLIIFGVIIYFLPKYVFTANSNVSLGIHAQHILQAQKTQNTKLSVSMSPLTEFTPNKKTKITFNVFNADNGEQIKDFSINQEKLMHLIIINDELNYFDHVHPDFSDGTFSIDYTFPNDGFYRLYTDFLPKDSTEQRFSFRVKVGTPSDTNVSILKDFKTENEVDNIKASLILPKNITSKNLSEGKEIIGFKFTDAKTGADIKTIGKYLGAFGHLIMIRTEGYEYVHVHPKQTYTPIEGETSGPVVEFSPLGLYGDVKPGIYKLYGQFMIENKLYTFEFFVKVE